MLAGAWGHEEQLCMESRKFCVHLTGLEGAAVGEGGSLGRLGLAAAKCCTGWELSYTKLRHSIARNAGRVMRYLASGRPKSRAATGEWRGKQLIKSKSRSLPVKRLS